MEKDRQYVPRLRFKGFMDTWEQRRLPYLMERVSAMAESGILPSVEYDDIESDIGLLNKDVASKKITKKGIAFQHGDVLFGKLRPYLKNWLYCTFCGVAVGDFWVLRPLHANGLFFFYFMQTSGFQDVANQSTGSKMPRADWALVSEYDWVVPCNKEEQHKIGILLHSVDTLITLQQRKLSKLQDLKKALLTKMFPAEGESVPKLRFKGPEEAWKKRLFKDAFLERREKTEKENEDTLLSCAIDGMFLNSELFGHFRGTSTVGYLRIKRNDLILSAQNLHLGNANVNLRFEHGIISPAYKVYDLNGCNPDFIQAWVKKDDTKDFFLRATTEGASQCRKNIEWKTLGNQIIPMPSTIEQQRIGYIFKNIDFLITLHQRKLSKLKDIKNALLNNMFPGGDI